MHKKIFIFCLSACCAIAGNAQEQTENPISVEEQPAVPISVEAQDESPVIVYSSLNKRKYEIADIKVSGADNYEDFVLIGFSGLSVGDKISVPGEEITNAVKRFWKHGLFSNVRILATKMTDDKVWLEIALTQRPIVSDVQINGVKKGERSDLELQIGMAKGTQVTPNLIDRAKKVIKKYFEGKGFSNVDVNIAQKNDIAHEGKVILIIDVDKNEKTKIYAIEILGNEKVKDYALKVAMKKTNEGFSMRKHFRLSWRKLFSTKKYVRSEYETDKDNIISKYNELGYRDAQIVSDSVVRHDQKRVNIFMDIEEGSKYYLKDISWVGNTLYSTQFLDYVLNMKPGDVYNQKKLNERLSGDEDAVANVYYNHGYIFSRMDPVEVNIENDSISLEVRIFEGIQASINKVTIHGNDRLYEDIIRRELRTKPGQLFSREALMRSLRELAQMGHFDPESMTPDIKPDPETGTVDIGYLLASKANDQIEFSAGWGQTGVIGRLSLKFTNFSLKNFLHPSTYRGIIPQGEGQTLTLSGQTNGRYYQSYSISFMDPWFGGKRPNSLSIGAYYMIQTGVESRYYDNYYNNYYGYGYGYGGYGYGGYGDPYSSAAMYANTNESMKILGVSLGYGKRLTWPDDYFGIMAEISYQRYMMKNWQYFIVDNGDCNNLSVGLTLSRNSIDNPLYTREGSQFSASVNLTPPFSLWDGKDYATMTDLGEKNRWVEYHKWKFKGKVFLPLANRETVKRTPVLMNRIEYGFVGYYNKNKISPFETFYMGGDGMTGYYSTYATETIGLRGYQNGSLTPRGSEGYAYSRLSLELRYPFLLEPTSTIYGLTFVEGGNAWHTTKGFNPFELKRSAGVGIRIFLPMIGMMGLDWAYGFDRATPGSSISGSQIHFILGQEF